MIGLYSISLFLAQKFVERYEENSRKKDEIITLIKTKKSPKYLVELAYVAK